MSATKNDQVNILYLKNYFNLRNNGRPRNELLKSKVKDEHEAASQSEASINFVYHTRTI